MGATVTALAAIPFVSGGWILLYLASIKQINYSPVVLGIFYAIQQFGGIGAYYAGYVGNMGNFKLKDKGKVSGILLSAYGLSALLISQFYEHVFASEVPTLFLFMAVWTCALCLTGAAALRVVKPQSRKMHNAALALINGASSSAKYNTLSDSDGSSSTSPPTSDSSTPTPEEQAELTPPVDEPRYGQRGFLTLLSHFDFWLLATIAFCAAGSGLTFITIVGSVAESWGATATISAATYTTILSACNASGRIIYGYANDALRKYFRSVAFFLPICATIAVCHFALIFWTDKVSLMIGAILTGISYGGFFANINVIINKYYGNKNYSTNLGFNTLVISLSGLLWGVVSGKIYERFVIPGTKKCYGSQCYFGTFIITSALCAIACGVAIFLLVREIRDDRRKKVEIVE